MPRGRPKGSKNKFKELQKKDKKPITQKKNKKKEIKEEIIQNELKKEIKKEEQKEEIKQEVKQEKKRTRAPKDHFTCQDCGGIFHKNEAVIYNGKNYCKECYNKFGQEVEDFKKLTDYIYCDIYNKDCNLPLINTQLKKLKEEIPDLTDNRIYKILKYAIDYEDVETSELDPEWGINQLINKYFYKAKKFYDLKASINNNEEEIDEALNLEPKVVIIKRSEMIKQQEEYEEERRKRYAKQMLGEKDMEEIMDFFNEFGTNENLGFKEN